jgi:putative ABC transport system permease protein
LTGSGRASPFVEAEYKFTVCGVMNMEMGIGINFRNLIIPYQTAKSIERLSFNTPFELLSQLSGEGKQEYPSLTVRVKSSEHFESAKDSIEALGYNTFSFADQFEEIKKVFVVFDMVLGVVGFIALVVASLGIINTMVMSIIERYREIGILKSLGADNRDIRWLFLVESSSIGFIGSLLGLLFGWIITRIGSAVAKYFMVKQGAPSIEMFHLPIWLIILALVFGTTVSLLAGMYPASRASRIDPVQALRHD